MFGFYFINPLALKFGNLKHTPDGLGLKSHQTLDPPAADILHHQMHQTSFILACLLTVLLVMRVFQR